MTRTEAKYIKGFITVISRKRTDNVLPKAKKSFQKTTKKYTKTDEKNELNRGGKYVKETTTRPTSDKKQPIATNGPTTKRENPASGGGLQIAPQQICVVVHL